MYIHIIKIIMGIYTVTFRLLACYIHLRIGNQAGDNLFHCIYQQTAYAFELYH